MMGIQSARRLPIRLAVLGLLTLGLASCGGEKMIEVKGKVLYGTEPLKSTGLDQAIVQYQSQGESENKIPKQYQGKFDEQGNFSLEAPPGKYKVVVIATKMPPKKSAKDEYAIPESVIPKVYSDAKMTDHSVEVKANAPPGHYDIKLAKAK